MAWTDQMVEDLKRMWKEGLTTGEIGKRLNVSKNSIVGKVHRLGLSGRPPPIKKKETTPAPSKPATPKPTKVVKEEKITAPKPAPVEKKKEEPIKEIFTKNITPPTSPVKNTGNLSLTDLDNHTCRWPIGDPKDDNFHFCGKKVRIGQTYCEEHAAVAYVKPTKK